MTYQETLDFLYSQLPAYHRIGKAAYKNDLHNTLALDDYFNHPHKKYKTIHIAGTNGKGSVSHMIASVLQEAGFRTGLYTSPHLKDFRERIKVNGEMIPENEVISFVEDHKDMLKEIQPSFFEMSVAMAFDYFARANVDIAVIEVGLGGRLDSTNIITPVISVITNIGHDHMDLLGDTPAKVAKEKAGIIKKGIPVVIGETTSGTHDVFIASAGNSDSEICFADENFSCLLDEMDFKINERHYIVSENKGIRSFEGTIPLGGDYQKANLRTVFQVFSCFEGVLKVTEENMVDGIRNVVKNTGLLGRWQILGRDPLIVCDTGHNYEGLEYVIKQLLMIQVVKRHFVVGFVSDKDLSSVLPLFPADAEYYFTRASVPRAMDERKLMIAANVYGLKGKCYSSVGEAYTTALANASRHDLIFIGGSTFIVAEVI
ncbi:MAG: bifunctional folylpolyglutamate synthase/dihydrofolate synthase [Bacteroidetes bacterium]|nr:bifunctional folylpolyglutamate synthase/dihydrofolate synthase [Bacteroidota bacterium]